jgi:acyl-CoA reductase-like NAD-dependent aldehyde dehydrogenase
MAIASSNPATAETLREFEALTEEGLEERLAAAEQAFDSYRRTSSGARAAILLAVADLLERETDKHAHTITLEMGKPIGAARDEVLKCAKGCRYYAENGERFLEEEVIQTAAAHSSVLWQPLGPILAGLSLRCASLDGGQRWPAQACRECAAMRARHRRPVASSRRTVWNLSILAHRSETGR